MSKTIIKSEVVADSLSLEKDRLTSIKVTVPYISINAILEHCRELSITYTESINLPLKDIIEAVQNDPFIPIAWQKHHSGVQGNEYFTNEYANKLKGYSPYATNELKRNWLLARDNAVKQATELNELGLTKQLCNRLLEPFMWTTMLITGSKEGWDNFFRLRCPSYQFGELTSNTKVWKSKKEAIRDFPHWENNTDLFWLTMNKGQAEIHMMDLAEKIYDAMNESTPEQLKVGEWHVPLIRVLEN